MALLPHFQPQARLNTCPEDIQRQKCKVRLPLIQVNTNTILIELGGLESVSFNICQPGCQVMFGTRNAQHMTHLESVSCLVNLPVLDTGLGSSQSAVLRWEHFGLSAASVRVQPYHRVWPVWHIPGVHNCLVVKCPRRSVHLTKVQIYRDILILLPTANGKVAKILIYRGILTLLLTADGKVFSVLFTCVLPSLHRSWGQPPSSGRYKASTYACDLEIRDFSAHCKIRHKILKEAFFCGFFFLFVSFFLLMLLLVWL